MSYCRKVYKFLGTCWDNFTWFSMVAMNGDEGDRRYKQYKAQGKL